MLYVEQALSILTFTAKSFSTGCNNYFRDWTLMKLGEPGVPNFENWITQSLKNGKR